MKKISPQYNVAVQTIKAAILQSQLETARVANTNMLSLYYGIGKYVSENTRGNVWGTNAIETISEQLRRELPELRGLGASNIKKHAPILRAMADGNKSPAVGWRFTTG